MQLFLTSVESVYHPTAAITLSPFVRKEGVFSQPPLRLYGELIEGWEEISASVLKDHRMQCIVAIAIRDTI